MEVPDLLGHTLEAGGLVLVEPNVGIGNLFHSWITGSSLRADKLVAGISTFGDSMVQGNHQLPTWLSLEQL